MFQIPNGNLVVGTFSIVMGIIEIAAAVVIALTGKPKSNEVYRYDLQWLHFGVVQITIGFMMIFG